MQAVIRWCLEIDPANRPSSAVDVVEMLRGGGTPAGGADAARVPAPELILARRHEISLTPRVAATVAAAAIAAALMITPQVDQLTHLNGALPEPPGRLSERARVLLAITHGAAAVNRGDHAFGFLPDTSRQPRDATRPRPLLFAYRHHDGTLMPSNLFRVVTLTDPPSGQPGMASVILDSSGRLRAFDGTASVRSIGSRDTDWRWWFEMAGLGAQDYVASDPGPSIGTPHDRQFAWRHAADRDAPVVRAATLDGMPVYFGVGDENASPAIGGAAAVFSTHRTAAGEAFFWSAIAIGFVGATLLALRNLRRHRGHREAANRVAVFAALVGIAIGLLRAHHVPDVVEETSFVLGLSGWCVMWAVFCWVCYLAIEPPLRRHAPHVLAAWTRLLSGRVRDPVVGREVLLGVVGGIVVIALATLRFRLVPLRNADLVLYHALESLQGWRRFAYVETLGLLDAVETALAGALLVVLVRSVARSVGVAACHRRAGRATCHHRRSAGIRGRRCTGDCRDGDQRLRVRACRPVGARHLVLCGAAVRGHAADARPRRLVLPGVHAHAVARRLARDSTARPSPASPPQFPRLPRPAVCLLRPRLDCHDGAVRTDGAPAARDRRPGLLDHELHGLVAANCGRYRPHRVRTRRRDGVVAPVGLEHERVALLHARAVDGLDNRRREPVPPRRVEAAPALRGTPGERRLLEVEDPRPEVRRGHRLVRRRHLLQHARFGVLRRARLVAVRIRPARRKTDPLVQRLDTRGGRRIRIRGDFDRMLQLVRQLSDDAQLRHPRRPRMWIPPRLPPTCRQLPNAWVPQVPSSRYTMMSDASIADRSARNVAERSRANSITSTIRVFVTRR